MKQIITTLLFLTVFIANLNSQIVFTDINPDEIINEFLQGYAINFDNDAKIDAHLTLLDNTGVWTMLLIPDDVEDANYVVNQGGNDGGAKILNFGDEISPSSNYFIIGDGWGDLLYGHWDSDGDYGHWTGVQNNKYLGFKFKISSKYHYAWLYLSTEIHANDDMEFTVQSYAYNSVAGEKILAGDDGIVNIKNNLNKKVSVYPNPANNFLNISGIKNTEDLNVQITDISGKLIEHYKLKDNSIDVSKFNSGIYFLRINNGKEVYNSRFLKK